MPESPSTPPAPEINGLIRALYRRAYWSLADHHHWRDIISVRRLVYLGGGGIGDSLNCSAVLRAFAQREPGRTSIMTPHPELFLHNPDARSIHPYDYSVVVAMERWGKEVLHPAYSIPRRQPPIPPRPEDHLLAQLARSAGLRGELALRPWLHLSPHEKAAFSSYGDAVVLQSSCLHARHALPAKHWPGDRMSEVARRLRPRHRLVQTGHPDDPLLPGVEDLRGKLSLRQSAALLANARFFVGLVGFLMHLARAVDTRSVIVYGGREHPLQSGYVANENLVGVAPCSPCGIDEACPIGHPCMLGIGPDDVLSAIDRLERRLGPPLETATVTLA